MIVAVLDAVGLAMAVQIGIIAVGKAVCVGTKVVVGGGVPATQEDTA